MASENEVVLVHIDNNPGFFARIESVTPDVKPGWWQVRLLVLSHPLQVFTWIIDDSQLNGAPFTMGGTPVMIEKVVAPSEPQQEKAKENKETKSSGKVVSLADRKNGK